MQSQCLISQSEHRVCNFLGSTLQEVEEIFDGRVLSLVFACLSSFLSPPMDKFAFNNKVEAFKDLNALAYVVGEVLKRIYMVRF